MPGSGKTTLAKEIRGSLDLPVFHLDKLLWCKGWVLRPKQNFLKDLQDILKKDRWIIEGASHSTLATRYPLSNIVIYLNPPRLICLWRVLKRVSFNRSQPSDKPEECCERVNWEFIKYLWRFKAVASKQINKLKEQYPNIQVVEIINAKELELLKNQFWR